MKIFEKFTKNNSFLMFFMFFVAFYGCSWQKNEQIAENLPLIPQMIRNFFQGKNFLNMRQNLKKAVFPGRDLTFSGRCAILIYLEGAFRRGAGVQGVFLMQST